MRLPLYYKNKSTPYWKNAVMGSYEMNYAVRKQGQAILAITLFCAYLFLGLMIFKDYGVHRDEFPNQDKGERWSRYIEETALRQKTDPASLKKNIHRIDISHGPFFETILTLSSRLVLGNKADTRDVLLFRHGTIFLLFFLSSICFFLLCLNLFQSPLYALTGAIMFILHPRIFSHSFYNTVDIACLSFFIISFSSMALFVQKRGPFTLILHAICCAILFSTRAIGLVIPLLTVILLLDPLYNKRSKYRNAFPGAFLYALLFCALFCLFAFISCPLLWQNPLENLAATLKQHVFFQDYGRYSVDYNFYWIGITTPLLYIILFFTGLSFVTGSAGKILHDQKIMFLALATGLVVMPLLIPIITKMPLYNDWRHHYFIYPFFVLIAIYGLQSLINFLRSKKTNLARSGIILITMALGLSFSITMIKMVVLHPHQQVFVNLLAKLDKSSLKNEDQWTLSGRDGYEYILETYDMAEITVTSHDEGANLKILPQAQRQRFRVTKNNPDCIIRIWGNSKTEKISSQYSKIYALNKYGKEIMRVYCKTGIQQKNPDEAP